MRVSEQLDLAADVIERRGWVGTPSPLKEIEAGFDPWGLDGVSPVCIEGAIIAVHGVDEFTTTYAVTKCAAYAAVSRYLDLRPGSRLFNWNDAKGRTKEEVVVALRGAAAVERAKEESRQLVGV